MCCVQQSLEYYIKIKYWNYDFFFNEIVKQTHAHVSIVFYFFRQDFNYWKSEVKAEENTQKRK